MAQIKRILLLTALLMGVCIPQIQAQKTDIKGTVLDEDGEPAISIIIRDMDENGEVYGTTDLDGHFNIKADPATSLHFSGLTYMSKVVKLKGKTNINVVLSYESQKLDEVVVIAKRIVDKLAVDPTDIEIVGNQYIIRPKVKIPAEMFRPNTRIVVQPELVNISRKTKRLFSPAVVTGSKYAIALERMMEFDISRDPLWPYRKETTRMGNNEVVAFTDSLFIDNPDDDCRCDIYMYLVKYWKKTYEDSTVIAKGTVNPMRFFNYKTTAMRITDNKYIPKPEKQMRGDKGEVSLTFVVNKVKVNDSDPNNAIELEKMQQRLLEIQDSPDTEFQSFSITGVSSPEGVYEKNLELAQKRTLAAKDKMFSCLRTATVSAFKDSISTGARVETWKTIVELMRRDSLDTDKLEAIISKYPKDVDGQSRAIRRLPDYPAVIAAKYLPRSRKVEYSFTYSVMRQLRDDEIRRLYKRDYQKLTRYEFWRICSTEKPGPLKEKACRQALEIYPTFMLIANELAVQLIDKGEPDMNLLEPFVNDKAPVEILNNQVAALLMHREFLRADSVAGLMPDSEQTNEIRAIARAFNGNYQEAYDRFASEGGVNEVVLLLALKRNEEAWEKAQALSDDKAVSYYLRAICANRQDMVVEAAAFLKTAIARDPKLKDIARLDGDVMDLIELPDDKEKEK